MKQNLENVQDPRETCGFQAAVTSSQGTDATGHSQPHHWRPPGSNPEVTRKTPSPLLTDPGSQTPELAPFPTHKEPIEGSSVKGQISERWALPVGAAFRLVAWDPQEEMHFRSQTSIKTHHI